jgi:hypothetical protein
MDADVADETQIPQKIETNLVEKIGWPIFPSAFHLRHLRPSASAVE